MEDILQPVEVKQTPVNNGMNYLSPRVYAGYFSINSISSHTVDGQNHAPPGMIKTL